MADPRPPRSIVVMGVSGAGKSTVGALLAHRLGVEFIEGDALHPAHNLQQMASGHPLTDAERIPWLRLVGESIRQCVEHGSGVVAACSALKRSYRDVLREYSPCFFVLLDGPAEVLRARVLARPASVMPPSLLASQLDTLEPLERDEAGVTVDLSLPPGDIVAAVARYLGVP